jgi:hypothetical protein
MDRAGWNYPEGEFRVSDADRDHALSALSEAFQVGRITADEFDQRSGQALSSRTGSELAALLADLPPERAPATRATAPDRAHRLFATRAAFAAAVAAICFVTVAVSGFAKHPGLSHHQLEVARGMAARAGLGMPPPPRVFPSSSGFEWAGAIYPAAIAVLLVLLIVYLRVRSSLTHRP